MPTLLNDHLVADSLTALTEWSGDPSCIERTVSLDANQTEELLGEVAIAANSMNHHPEIDRSGDSTTFRLRTEREGGVTELDIYLASRIDDLVLKACGAGVPGEKTPAVAGAPTREGMGTGGKGTGRREGGRERTDAHVVATAAQAADGGIAAGADQGEPFINVPAGSGGAVQPGVAAPSDFPGEPQPGISRPEGQGAEPGGQNTDDRA